MGPVLPRPDDPETALIRSMASFFDAGWYQQRYPDVVAAKLDPIRHFIRHGLAERRDPNRFFDSAWYVEHYPDVNASGQHPLLRICRPALRNFEILIRGSTRSITLPSILKRRRTHYSIISRPVLRAVTLRRSRSRSRIICRLAAHHWARRTEFASMW